MSVGGAGGGAGCLKGMIELVSCRVAQVGLSGDGRAHKLVKLIIGPVAFRGILLTKNKRKLTDAELQRDIVSLCPTPTRTPRISHI